MSAPARILGLVIAAALILVVALIPVGRRNHRQIVAIAISKNGAIAAGTSSGRIAIWSGSSQPREISLTENAPLNDLQFSPDGRYLAVGGPDLVVISIDSLTSKTIRNDRRNYGSVRFSEDGLGILTITGASTIELIRIASGSASPAICCSTIYGEIAFTPDHTSIVNAGHWPRIWSLQGDRTANLTSERQFMTFRPIAFAEPNRVLMGSQDGRVYVWDLGTHAFITRSPAQPGYVDTIVVLDDSWIAFARFIGAVRLWNMQTSSQRILESARPSSNILAGTDGRSLLFGTSSGSVEIRSTEDGRLKRELILK